MLPAAVPGWRDRSVKWAMSGMTAEKGIGAAVLAILLVGLVYLGGPVVLGWVTQEMALHRDKAWLRRVYGQPVLVGNFSYRGTSTLAELLRREKVGPIVGRVYRGWVPEEALAQPSPSPPGLAQPDLPAEYGSLRPREALADSTIAVTVYGSDRDVAPCVVAINDGTATVHRILGQLWDTDCWIVPYEAGRGVVLLVEGRTASGSPWAGLHNLRRPGWEPESILDLTALGLKCVSLVGQSRDGSRVWVLARRGDACDLCLWVYDASTCASDLVCYTRGVHVMCAIPSPDEKLLAVRQLPLPDRGSEMPLYVVDCVAGRIRRLTPAGPRSSRYAPVGWSTVVPRRLYFTDRRANLWRIDVPEQLP